MACAGSCRSVRQAAQASGWVFHQAAVLGSGSAPGRVCRLAVNVESSCLSAVYAAEPKLSIECGPGMGPSDSTSVLM
jgi:hypothetical protein